MTPPDRDEWERIVAYFRRCGRNIRGASAELKIGRPKARMAYDDGWPGTYPPIREVIEEAGAAAKVAAAVIAQGGRRAVTAWTRNQADIAITREIELLTERFEVALAARAEAHILSVTAQTAAKLTQSMGTLASYLPALADEITAGLSRDAMSLEERLDLMERVSLIGQRTVKFVREFQTAVRDHNRDFGKVTSGNKQTTRATLHQRANLAAKALARLRVVPDPDPVPDAEPAGPDTQATA